MPKALSTQARALPARVEAGPAVRRDLHGLGLPAEGLREVGRAGLRSGCGTASSATEKPRSRPGTGRPGTRPTSATGRARPRSSSSSTTTRSTPCGAPCRTARVGGPDTLAAAPSSREASWSTACGTNYATGERHAARLRRLPRQGRAQRTWTATSAWGSPRSSPRSTTASRSIASCPQLRRTPIVIGESDPEGCAACQGPQLAYRNGTMYSSYTAASFARKHDLAARHGVNLEGALTWAFEFEDQPYFAGFRALATNGIELPVLNVFRMFARMGGERVAAESSGEVPLETMLRDGVRGAPDVAALASAEPGRAERPGVALPRRRRAGTGRGRRAGAGRPPRRRDRGQGDASPDRRRPQQRLRGLAADGLADRPEPRAVPGARGRLASSPLLDAPSTQRLESRTLTLRLLLPRQAVSLVTIEWP